ncbi:hypothetical protein D3C81_502600 [compost metagenome]
MRQRRLARAVQVYPQAAVGRDAVGDLWQFFHRHRAGRFAAAPVRGVHALAVGEGVVAPVLTVGRHCGEQVVVGGAFQFVGVTRVAGDGQQFAVELHPRQHRAGFHIGLREERARGVEHLTRTMRHAAPRTTAEGEVLFADVVPQVVDGQLVVGVAGGLVQLGQADQIPRQLVRLAGGDERCVFVRDALVEQCKARVGVGLLQDLLGQRQIARLAGDQVQISSRVQQHRGRHAVVVAQRGDVDARFQRLPTQVGDVARGLQIALVTQRTPGFQEAEDQVAVRPDVPGAQRRFAVPALRLGRLRHGEAAVGGVVAEIAVVVLLADQPIGDATQVGFQFGLPALRDGTRGGRQPFAGMLAVPVTFLVLLLVRLAEDADRRAFLIHDEVAQAAAAVGAEHLPQHAFQLHGGRCDQLLAAGDGCTHAASTTQRKPSMPLRSLAGAISRYLPCWSRR